MVINSEPDNGKRLQRQLIAALDAELGIRRWSRRHLAEVSGINRQTMDRIFTFQRDLNIEQLGKIAEALGVQPDDIMSAAITTGIDRAAGRISTGLPPKGDPRALLVYLLAHPTEDPELITRLDEARQHVGDTSGRAKRLADQIRATRSAELQRRLDALPFDSNWG